MPPLTCIFTVGLQRHIRQHTLYLDVRPERHELRRNLHTLQLPLRQFRLMQALMANYPKPMTHWELFYHVWGEGTIGFDGIARVTDEDGGPLAPNCCIEQLARKLRIKLAPLGLTVQAPRKGYGYQIMEKETTREEATIPLEEADPQGKITKHTSGKEAQGEVCQQAADHREVGDQAPAYPQKRKARPQQVRPVTGSPIGSPGITLTIEKVRVRR